MAEEHKNSITGVEALQLASNLLQRLHDRLADDNKLDFSDWLAIATETGKEVFEEYTDEDDV
jgi:hypothetical protein